MFGTNSRDWECGCGEKNFAKRSECRKCGSKKNQFNENTSLQGTVQADWVCKCGEKNFAKRLKCRKCDENKQSSIEEELCVVCLDKKKSHAIVNCGHLCMCSNCYLALKLCPLCRGEYSPTKDVIEIYK